MIKISCITAVRNVNGEDARAMLARCVRSVAAVRQEHEHLFYDGASTDGTADEIRRLATADCSVKVVSEPDTGIYNALNKGVREAKGEWFYVLGSDDYLADPKTLDEILSAATDDVDVIVTPVLLTNSDPKKIRPISDQLLFCGAPYCHQGVLVRTSVLREFGGFDERYQIAADLDLFLRLHLANKKFKFVDRAFACYAHGGASDRYEEKTRAECADALCRQLHLGAKAVAFFRRREYPPFPSVMRYALHPNPSVRKSVAHVWGKWSVYCRICFYDATITRARRWIGRLRK